MTAPRMRERTYTVREIDALRRVVENKWLWGRYGGPVLTGDPYGGQSRTYRETEKAVAVEQMVRTHMLAGHAAEDLLASEAKDGAMLDSIREG